MNPEQIREYFLTKPGVTESLPFNYTALVFKVADKMFALLDLSEDSRGISLKCDPELALELREQYPEVTPAYHFSKIILPMFYTAYGHIIYFQPRYSFWKGCNFVEKEDIMNSIEMTAIFEPCDEGGYIAYIEEIPGINSQGETIEEAKENLTDAINLMFEERRASQKANQNRTVKKLIIQTLSFSL